MNYNILLLVHLCYLVVAQAYYDTVKVRIRNGDELIQLNWKRTAQYLANTNLPVWFAKRYEEPHRATNIFAGIGEFITYHDLKKSSAVVYNMKCNCFFGIIDTRFYIAQLPLLDLDSNVIYEVGSKYVFSRQGLQKEERFHESSHAWLNDMFTDDEIKYINSIISTNHDASTFTPSLQQNYRAYDKPSTSVWDVSHPDEPHVKASTERPKVLYPEILVFITNDVYEAFIDVNVDNRDYWFVLHYIIYFNAIDMLFAKLTSDEISVHINIAGLIIEIEHGVFPHRLWMYEQPKSRRISYYYDGATILNNHMKYIDKYKNIFVQDSFDFFFISTSHKMKSNDAMVHAVFTPMFDMFTRRSIHRGAKLSLGLAVQRALRFGDFVTAAYHIVRLMGIKPQTTSEGLNRGNQQCSSIMQSRPTYCENCLNWSDQSRNDLRAYVRSNRNHCFLLNYPRSLHPYGQPVLSLNPEDQCMCYNYSPNTLNPFYITSIPNNACDKPIQCSNYQNALEPLALPIDGTPCGGPHQVCWQKKCVSLW